MLYWIVRVLTSLLLKKGFYYYLLKILLLVHKYYQGFSTCMWVCKKLYHYTDIAFLEPPKLIDDYFIKN